MGAVHQAHRHGPAVLDSPVAAARGRPARAAVQFARPKRWRGRAAGARRCAGGCVGEHEGVAAAAQSSPGRTAGGGRHQVLRSGRLCACRRRIPARPARRASGARCRPDALDARRDLRAQVEAAKGCQRASARHRPQLAGAPAPAAGGASPGIAAVTTRIKICGVTHPDHARAAADAGAHLVGLVFHAASPRAIDRAAAERIVSALPASVEPVALLVDADEHHPVLAWWRGAVQLHGNEGEADCAAIAARGHRVLRGFGCTSLSLKRWDACAAVDTLVLDGPRPGSG
ncbi:MAG: hypothetical protein JNK53_08830, partial [Phycisphaerae bacterium]|nr:hypothetical protein [Phycisphaerae bacterium]